MLQFTATPSFTVRVGDEVTLPCEHVIDGQKCNSSTWVFSELENTPIVVLIGRGRIAENAKSDRLSVTEKCSLVIKNVTEEDAGLYTCRQFNKSGQQQGEDALVELSIVTRKKDEEVTLYRLKEVDGTFVFKKQLVQRLRRRSSRERHDG
uniref:Ig-like domain-containing protein n=1 Tax=Sander lucioperca TaxID=283035 RepID=A0A8C9XFJ9_SANLU